MNRRDFVTRLLSGCTLMAAIPPVMGDNDRYEVLKEPLRPSHEPKGIWSEKLWKNVAETIDTSAFRSLTHV